jgi:hypothetical protein
MLNILKKKRVINTLCTTKLSSYFFCLFIISLLVLVLGIFWTLFHSDLLSPAIESGAVSPLMGTYNLTDLKDGI